MAGTKASSELPEAQILEALDTLKTLGVDDVEIARDRAPRDGARFQVAFVGEWNSGKSTLINLLLERAVVPVGRFPETGAACFIHRDAAECVTASWSDGRSEAGPGSIEVIRDWVQITRQGLRTATDALPQTIEIGAPEIDLPNDVDLVDTPGLNDDPEMIDRALAAALAADAIVFVLNTRYFLTTAETDVILALANRSVRPGILFALNAFLTTDSPDEWQEFETQDLPPQQAKLRELLARLDCVPEGPFIPVSGRAASAAMGAGEFRAAVRALWDADTRAQLSRSRRAAALRRALVRASAITSERLRPLETALADAERSFQGFQRDQQRRDTFLEVAESAIGDAMASWESNAELATRRVASQITTSSLRRDDTHSDELTEALAQVGRRAANELFDNLENIALTYQQREPDASDRRKIRGQFALGTLIVRVANTDMGGGGAAAGAAAGAAIGTVVPIVGTLLGGLIGGVIGAARSGSAAMDRDVFQTRENVLAAVSEAVDDLDERREALSEVVQSLQRSVTPVDAPDNRSVAQWRALASDITRLLRQA